MRAVVIDYSRRELREKDVAEPRRIYEDQVLFRVREVGICGTDRELAAFRFGYGPAGDEYLVLGHEACGEVIEAGSKTVNFSPGDIVVPAVRRPCHPPCRSCTRDRSDLCVSGGYTERGIFGAHGYFTDFAIDRAEYLTRVPVSLAEYAVLIEPLSVVEKACDRALTLHAGSPETALVLGAGTIGILAAAVLHLRGLRVDLVSIEQADSARARLSEAAGARYLKQPEVPADVVIEAAGSPGAAARGIRSLAPLGVLMILGAIDSGDPLPLLDLITGNRIIAGSVNASPEAFRQAAEDLGKIPRAVLSGLIERRKMSEFRHSLTGAPPQVPKIVHVIE